MPSTHDQQATSADAMAPIIPRTLLFSHPRRSSPQISPDGRHLAFLAPDDRGVLQICLHQGPDAPPTVLTRDPRRGIRQFAWTHQVDHLLYLQDSDGDENFHLYSVNIATLVVRDLTPFAGVRAELIALHHELSDEVLVALNREDRQRMDVHRLRLSDGVVRLDTPNPGHVMTWIASNLTILAAMVGADDGGQDLMLRSTPDDPWRVVRHWGPDEQGRPLAFSRDGMTLYLLSNHEADGIEADTMRLLAYDVATGTERVLAQDPTYDIEGVLLHPTDNTLQAVDVHRDKHEWIRIDPAVAADLQRLCQDHEGAEIHITSRTLDDATWIVSVNRDCRMPHYYRYDRGTGRPMFLFAANPQLDRLVLGRKQPIRIPARDGMTLHGYLTVPPGLKGEKLPTVLFVHGGPWMRDGWGFWSTMLWLADRGYAVLQVNFRGSTGYGRAYLNAGNRQWAGAMHDDLIDTVNWAIDRGVADPKRVAIMGASYGGYATLVGLTFTPEVFCAGIDLVGPSNLVTLLSTTPPWWRPLRAMLNHRVGDPTADAQWLRSRSPLFLADRIRRPLLIGQGANDPRVRQAESDQIVEAMRRANLPVQYVVYSDEGHSLLRPENRLHFHALAEQFLATHLGGRCEPMGEIPGHTGQVRDFS